MVTKTCLCDCLGVWRGGGGGVLTKPLGGHWRDAVGCLTIDDLKEEGGQVEEEEEETPPFREGFLQLDVV